MNLSTRDLPGIKIAVVNGRIDHASADRFSAELTRLLAECQAQKLALLLDFSAVGYISSVGLRALMVASRQAAAQDSKIAVAALQPLVQEVFTISRFSLILACYDSVDAACEALA